MCVNLKRTHSLVKGGQINGIESNSIVLETSPQINFHCIENFTNGIGKLDWLQTNNSSEVPLTLRELPVRLPPPITN
jgi:hypothetical protein